MAELNEGADAAPAEAAPLVHGPLTIKAKPAWGWCAGLRHPPRASYPADFFTAPQIFQLRRDATLTIDGLPPDEDEDAEGKRGRKAKA